MRNPDRTGIHMIRRQSIIPAAAVVMLLVQRLVAATVNLNYESAPSPDGPWEPVEVGSKVLQADGSISVEAEGNRFYRLRIEGTGAATPSASVRLGALPPDAARRLASRLPDLGRFLRPILIDRSEPTNGVVQSPLDDLLLPGAWKTAVLSSNAIPIYDPAWRGGLEPAYVEVKLVAAPVQRRNPGLEGSTQEQDSGRGSILLSLTDADLAIPSFSEQGSTPSERLVAQLGLTDGAGRRLLSPPAGHRVMRYGPTFHALENASGVVVASLGAQPFRPPRELASRFPMGNRGRGDETGGEPGTNLATGLALGFGGYSNYGEFKRDYLENPTYQLLRARRAARARAELEIEAGRVPEAPTLLRMVRGTSIHILDNSAVDAFFLDEDDAEMDAVPFVTVTASRGGGLDIAARGAGQGNLTIRSGRQVLRYQIRVGLVSRAASTQGGETFVPGWQEPQVWDAGGYDEQPRYWQVYDPAWCKAVGCGPTAWAILLGWWDRHGVPSAFAVGSGAGLLNSLRNQDAPLWLDLDSDSAGYYRVVRLYHRLHESCNVMCFGPFSDAGATAPDDMVQGWWGPTTPGRRTTASGVYMPYPLPEPPNRLLGYSYKWSWDLMDPDWNEPSNVIRSANKKGRPAIVGLGWLWHYGVSYAYRLQEFKQSQDGPVLATRQWFRVNEGWGKDNGEWYSGDDTFLGFDLKLTQKNQLAP